MAQIIRRPAAADAGLYDQDFAAWAAKQAAHARAGRAAALDLDHIAEELEGVNVSLRNEIESRLTIILLHLLKMTHQPSHRSRSWEITVGTQRLDIKRVIRRNPSLKTYPAKCLPEAYADARKLAGLETGLDVTTFPERCPFSVEQALEERWLP